MRYLSLITAQNNEMIFANLHWQPFSPPRNVSECTAEPRKQGTANRKRSTDLTANHVPFIWNRRKKLIIVWINCSPYVPYLSTQIAHSNKLYSPVDSRTGCSSPFQQVYEDEEFK